MKDWTDLDITEAAEQAVSLGLPAFRGRQIFEWVHAKHVFSYDAMSNLPAALREKLSAEVPFAPFSIVRKQVSRLDGTAKYLFALADDSLIEAVLMHYHHGYTVCVSSQVGCRMGCRFCASGLEGLVRNLTAGEMLREVYAIEQEAGIHVSNIVVMGCGEPFDNYDAVVQFLQLLHEPKAHNMSYRNMTVSTCGLKDGLIRWTKDNLPVTLAISLHAPNDTIRQQMMPVANSIAMEEMLDLCHNYTEKTGKRITFEYALVKGVNNQPEHAKELAGKLSGMLCHVNLIPVNPVTEQGLARPDMQSVYQFQHILEEHHIPATVRRELGRDIDGACGQLRRRHRIEMEAVQ